MNEWLPPMLDTEEQKSARKALHNRVQKAAMPLINGTGKQLLQRMGYDDLHCRLFNKDDSNRNPYGVVTGGTDLGEALELEAQSTQHPFSVGMGYSHTKQIFLTDIAAGGYREGIEFETRFVHEVINALQPNTLREAIANILVNGYLGNTHNEECSMEDLDTNTRPTWREGSDIAWIAYECQKLREVYEQLCAGTFTSRFERS